MTSGRPSMRKTRLVVSKMKNMLIHSQKFTCNQVKAEIRTQKVKTPACKRRHPAKFKMEAWIRSTLKCAIASRRTIVWPSENRFPTGARRLVATGRSGKSQILSLINGFIQGIDPINVSSAVPLSRSLARCAAMSNSSTSSRKRWRSDFWLSKVCFILYCRMESSNIGGGSFNEFN